MNDINLLEVLEYIFKYSSQTGNDLSTSKDAMLTKLEEYGYSKEMLEKAFSWLSDLVKQQLCFEKPTETSDAFRIFTQREIAKLSLNCRNTLLTLGRLGILDIKAKEIVIHQLMQINKTNIDVEELTWVVALVLLSTPNQKDVKDKLDKLSLTLLSQKHEC